MFPVHDEDSAPEQAQAAQGAEGGPEAEAQPADDVVDAEFEEVDDDKPKSG